MCTQGKQVQHKGFQDDAGVRRADKSKTTTPPKKKKLNTERKEMSRIGPLIRRTKRETLGCLTGMTKGNRQRAGARIGSYIKIQREWELIKAGPTVASRPARQQGLKRHKLEILDQHRPK